MSLLQYNNDGDFGLAKFFENDIPEYAILSHTWSEAHEEVLFNDMRKRQDTKRGKMR